MACKGERVLVKVRFLITVHIYDSTEQDKKADVTMKCTRYGVNTAILTKSVWRRKSSEKKADIL